MTSVYKTHNILDELLGECECALPAVGLLRVQQRLIGLGDRVFDLRVFRPDQRQHFTHAILQKNK